MIMIKIKYMAMAALAAIAISSCDNSTDTLGNSLTSDSDRLQTATGTFQATSHTIVTGPVLTKSNYCYLGRVTDAETNTEVKCEFTTQFYVLEDLTINTQYITSKADDKAAADSCDLIIYMASPFRDLGKNTAMQLRVQELGQMIAPTQLYYSDYDPSPLYREDGMKVSHLFTYTNMTDDDGARAKTNYLNNVRIPLNKPYTDKDGKTYSNYGTYILRQYIDNREHFRNSYLFAQHVCPGFSIEITDGDGLYANVTNVGLRVYYRDQVPDSAEKKRSIVFAGTEEVVNTIRITNDAISMSKLAAQTDSDFTYLKTPAGLLTEVTLPVKEIWNGHETDSLLATKVTFQRMHNNQNSDYTFGTPATLLIVMRDSLQSYFTNKQLPDNRTSYYTTYNSTFNTYTFTNISNLVSHLWCLREKGIKMDTNWEVNHPNWNKIVLVPIAYSRASTNSSTLTWVGHDLSLTSTRIAGGTKPIELNVVYGRFSR